MDETTRQRLNAINQEFYRITADAFDQTRSQPWPGWTILINHINLPDPCTVLDVGCGNGRFGVFLGQRIVYHGMDSSADLLAHASAALTGDGITLEQRDIVLHPPDQGQYDLVVAFGLLHHIPGNDQRLVFVRTLADRVKPGGWLAFATWRFMDHERFVQRVVAWPDDLQERVEAGDYLLDWRRGQAALRYCHHVDDDEHRRLVAATGLRPVATYDADDFNRYSVLFRPESGQ